jgi:hypothetical protein
MKRRLLLSLTFTAFGLSLATGVMAQGISEIRLSSVGKTRTPMQRQTSPEGLSRKSMVLPGGVAKANIQKVNSDIQWHTNLNSAQGQAQRQKKMVLWIHLVGNLSGAT